MFIHLHNHSHYSLLDGLPKIDDYVTKALEYKMPALGLTDHGVMYGAIEFYQKCKEKGIKPIIGCEIYVAPRELHLKHHGVDDKLSHLVLLAKNYEGYKNLMFLTTVAHLDGFYYKPRVDKKILREKAAGLIATSACAQGVVATAWRQGGEKLASEAIAEFQEIFGPENFYLELEYIGNVPEQLELNQQLIKLAKKIKAPLTASRDTHYIEETDKVAQDVLLCVQTGKVLSDENRLKMTGVDLSFLHPRLMEEYFKELAPEAVKNTEKIAAECNLILDLDKWYFPNFELPTNMTAEEQLKNLAHQGLAEKFPDAAATIKQRFDYELDVICKKGYAPYFLIVSDLVKWARENKIITTTRGSAAGSLISYLVEITTLNPLEYGLPFERFLNPFRPSPPDIDMDFADDKRDLVIDYATQKYGQDKVARIVTFGTMMARAAVRDVTRVLDLPYEFGDKIAKLIPFGSQGFQMTIDRALQDNPELKEIYNQNEDMRQMIELAKKVEGCVRHASVHAAGVVIAPTSLTDFTPLQKDPSGENILTQYEMNACEAVGLLKMDFLGIRNLSILGKAVKIVEKTKGLKIDLENLPLADKKTFDFIGQGYTFGMFQLGGGGMTRWMMELKPTTIKDIMAMIALFRPGPMESIPEYIARKHGQKPVSYLDKKFEPILKDSYGVITYQDDVLLIAIEVAGYNWETVDKFRKAIGKKIPELMAQQEKDFVAGCQKHSGWSREKAEKLWQLFDPFKGYGFNKAHAATYALVAYQTAYLKAHYPAEFMTAVMTAESGDTDKIVEACQECTRLGINVLPPDVNFSRPDFTYISDHEIRFGLLAIKNLGEDIANTIIQERKERGVFKSLTDFLLRIESKNLNKKSLEALIKSGAMDSLCERQQMLENMERLLAFIRDKNKEKNTQQTSLFGNLNAAGEKIPVLNLMPAEPAEERIKLNWEKELLGLYLSGHPFTDFQPLLAEHVTCQCAELSEMGNGRVKVAGVVSRIQKTLTRNSEMMMFLTIEDLSAGVEVLVFPGVLKNHQLDWREEMPLLVVGRVSDKEGVPKILADKLYELNKENFSQVMEQVEKDLAIQKERFGQRYYRNGSNSYNSENRNKWSAAGADNNFSQTGQKKQKSYSDSKTRVSKIWIGLPKYFNSEVHDQLKQVFNQSPGACQVYLTIIQSGVVRKIETDFKITYNLEIRRQLEEIVGSGNIKIEY